MKEAAGEANMTVITIVLIAIVLAVGTIVVTTMMNSTGQSSACNSAGGVWKGGRCCSDDSCGKTLSCTKATAENPTLGVKAGEWTCTTTTTGS